MSTRLAFTLTIRLGNDAMQTGDDIACAVRAVAKKVHDSIGPMHPREGDHGSIYDANGNAVGGWKISTHYKKESNR